MKRVLFGLVFLCAALVAASAWAQATTAPAKSTLEKALDSLDDKQPPQGQATATPAPAPAPEQAPTLAPAPTPAPAATAVPAPAPAPAAAPASSAKRRPVTLEGKSVLPLRVLARPFSNIYKTKDPAGGTVQDNLPVFQPYYVYTRPEARDIELQDGWYEVGSDNRGAVLGWMKASDVFEWKQTMCLAYTHPEGRKPVLMFADKAALQTIIKAPAQERAQKAQALYQAIDSKQIPPDFPVRSVEPKQAVDISRQFYFLPILDFSQIELDGREGRLVQLAAASAATPDARQSTDLAKNPDYLNQATIEADSADQKVLQALKVDVVFVMDTTVSMRPYIKSTLEVIKSVAQGITKDQALGNSIRFGAWGYRDPVDKIPGIGYTTFDYTPALEPVDQFIATLGKVEVTKVDSVDYQEDVFSGVADALANTKWTPGAMRVMVLLGDAPGHKLGHKFNASGQDQNSLRSLANDAKVYLFALHVQDPRAKRYHGEAAEQFQTLSRNKGMGQESAYYPVSSKDLAGFAQAAAELTATLNTMLSQAKEGKVMAGPVEAQKPPAAAVGGGELGALEQDASAPAADAKAPATGGDKPPAARDLAYQMLKAALVEWIGQQSGAKAPRDIVAWAVDKDLLEPAIQSMEVRLLINKRQLDSLKTVLSEVMAAGRRGQIGGEDFFAALQATAASAARDPNLIKNARTMAQTGLIPEFLVGLPYKSRLMSLNNDLWMRWSVDEQDEFLAELDARIKAYQAIHDRPEGWIAMNQGDDPDEYVYPISLDLLP